MKVATNRLAGLLLILPASLLSLGCGDRSEESKSEFERPSSTEGSILTDGTEYEQFSRHESPVVFLDIDIDPSGRTVRIDSVRWPSESLNVDLQCSADGAAPTVTHEAVNPQDITTEMPQLLKAGSSTDKVVCNGKFGTFNFDLTIEVGRIAELSRSDLRCDDKLLGCRLPEDSSQFVLYSGTAEFGGLNINREW